MGWTREAIADRVRLVGDAERVLLLIPSSRITERMKLERAGVWLERSAPTPNLWMVAKLPMNVIRAVHAGAAVALELWVVEIDETPISVFGLKVDDDVQHPTCAFGACRSNPETEDLRTVLKASAFPIQFHNELSLPILRVLCRSEVERARPVLDVLRAHPNSAERELRTRALDVVHASMTPDAAHDPRMKIRCEIPLAIEESEVLGFHVVGSGPVCLDDPDEGAELERLTFQAFEFLCPFGVYHQPQVEKGRTRRELCDVLAISRVREHEDEGVFVIQSKVASVTVAGLLRTTARRSSSIHKSILAAIGQLRGAVRRLRSGGPVYRADGTSIEDDLPSLRPPPSVAPLDLRTRVSKVGHAIAIISEMHEDADWRAIGTTLVEASQSTGFLFHVLDLRELQALVSYSDGRPAVLEAHLVRRWELVRVSGTALIRSQWGSGSMLQGVGSDPSDPATGDGGDLSA